MDCQFIDRAPDAGRFQAVLPALLNRSSLDRLMVRERLRSDRCRIPLATIELRLLTSTTRLDAERRKLTRLVQRQMRVTDQLGQLDNDRLMLILPDTDRCGAERLCGEILKLTDAGKFRLNVSVSIYPLNSADWDIECDNGSSSADDRRGRNGWEGMATDNPVLCMSIPRWKRAIDVTASATALVLLSPLLLAVAAAIKLTSRGPVLFRQWRDGQGGRPFVILKFRTMCVGAESQQDQLQKRNEQDGPAFKIDRDPRVTLIGRFLRASCIDELPQLVNVLRGEMSLVGPRPLPCAESRQITGWQARRMSVRPGLTCFWQVLRTTKVSFTDWMRLDLRYANRVRLTTDIALIGQTVAAIVGLKRR